eukprot:CAMPEP_0178448982 /NCGR_PEP_ID=MMETSP0689_2-20121128/42288_1 /TAXON_ID=160604 /ORGANISM="Amphidinium massartii, Strain CS-259" /LENGTH=35 /DNA_ID= /DNA_START= /DNA_END= /DNA_ORIENTATION=
MARRMPSLQSISPSTKITGERRGTALTRSQKAAAV